MDVEQEIQALKQVNELLLRSMVQSGTVLSFAGAKAPNDEWLICDGTAISRVGYATLFKVIGETYGSGDGSTTFNLPDLRGRTAIGAGQATGLTERIIGQAIGEENYILGLAEMPSHRHGGSTSSVDNHSHTGGTTATANEGAHTHAGATVQAGDHFHTGTTAIANARNYRTVECSGTEAFRTHEKGWGSCETFVDRNDTNFSNADHTHNFKTSSVGNHAHKFKTDNDGAHTHKFESDKAGAHAHEVYFEGNNQPHNVMQPSLVLNYIIKT
jgi:microcystin-dependent protein